MKKQIKIAVIGLGYVGLPIALEFSKKFTTVGFDINSNRINSLKKGIDINNEVIIPSSKISKKNIYFTDKKHEIKNCNIYIICVPTPVLKSKKPDLRMLINSCNIVSKFIKSENIVIFESTVYPTTTEKICLPILEKGSKLVCNKDNKDKNGFYLGYSPERINPGDKKNNLTNTNKLISSNSKIGLNKIYNLYKAIIKAKVIKVESIQVCESSKVIENIQRDVNIALMNEFSKIFRKMDLDIHQIIKYASTKWNFLKFHPGLVGGHCIGVDPYYLSYIAKKNKIDPKLIISGRKINDSMFLEIIKRINYLCNFKKINIKKSNILLMGYTFKENCSDTRNTQVKKIYEYYLKNSKKVEIYDPIVNEPQNVKKKLGIINKPKKRYYDIIILCVPHKKILKHSQNYINNLLKKNSIVLDFKNSFNRKNYFSI